MSAEQWQWRDSASWNSGIRDEEFVDAAIECGGQSFMCHQIILATSSPIFCAMFQADMREKETRTVVIQDIEPFRATNLRAAFFNLVALWRYPKARSSRTLVTCKMEQRLASQSSINLSSWYLSAARSSSMDISSGMLQICELRVCLLQVCSSATFSIDPE